MDCRTGEIKDEKDLTELQKKSKKWLPIPNDLKLDSAVKLQKRTLNENERRKAIKSLNRKKNKTAKKARQKNRK